MSGELLPALPEPGGEISERRIAEIERHVAENISKLDSIEEAREWQDQARALEAYLRSKDLQGPMLGAQRRVEARIGEFKELAYHGKHGINDKLVAEFRILARGLNGCELTEEEWRSSRRALVSLIRQRAGLTPTTPPLPTGTYRCVVADPPWQQATGPQKLGGKFADAADVSTDPGGSPLPYEQMSVADITALSVKELGAPASHLYLWTTARYLEAAHDVAREWGFEPSALLVWCKAPMGIGLGGTFRLTTEFVIFARRGKLKAKRIVESTWFQWKRGRHSVKPAAFYELVESVTPGPYLDMFARKERKGWTAWGDEVA